MTLSIRTGIPYRYLVELDADLIETYVDILKGDTGGSE